MGGKVAQVAVHETVEVVAKDIESFRPQGNKLMICSQKPCHLLDVPSFSVSESRKKSDMHYY